MSIPSDEEASLLEAALGEPLSPAAAGRLQSYLDLLLQWNGTYNLTAVRQRSDMLVQHLADCLAVVAPLRRQHAAGRLLDVGSGGGLPGVVLAICLPDWHVTCVDAVAKKSAFVRQVAAELRLPNLTATHARVEAMQAQPFDVITSRAFASLSDFIAHTQALLAPDGVWLAMKGKTPDDEIQALPAGIQVFHVEQLHVPGLNAQRCLVWMKP